MLEKNVTCGQFAFNNVELKHNEKVNIVKFTKKKTIFMKDNKQVKWPTNIFLQAVI